MLLHEYILRTVQVEWGGAIFETVESCLNINVHLFSLHFKVIFTNTFKSCVDEVLTLDKFLVFKIMTIESVHR